MDNWILLEKEYMQKKRQENLADLVGRLRLGDPKAQQIFWNTYLPQLCEACTRILSDPFRGEEVALEVLGDFLLNHLQHLKIPAAAPAYLRLMAIRKARKVKQRSKIECELPQAQTDDMAGADRMTEEVMAELFSARLGRCLEKLSPKPRQLLQLCFQNEQNHKAIGDLVGASGQYVGRVIGRSLQFLKRCLQLEATLRRAEGRAEGPSMNAAAVLTQSLKIHYAITPVTGCDEFELIAAMAEGIAGTDQSLVAHQHLASCDSCREDFQQLLRFKAEQVFSDPKAVVSDRPTRQVWRWSIAASVLLLFASTGIYFGLFHRTDESKLVAKGDAEELSIAVQRNVKRFLLRAEDRLVPGDQLGFFYTAKSDGYLMVLEVQQDGAISMLFPFKGANSSPVMEGTAVPLTDGGIFKPSQGCNWIIALFSDAPVVLETIHPYVQKAVAARQGCNLSVTVPGARSVFVQVIHE